MTSSNRTPIQLPLPIEDATVEIPLAHGFIAVIDSVDSDLVEGGWSVTRGRGWPYAIRAHKQQKEFLHRAIMERILGRALTRNEEVDHISCNTLDNRRSNLRVASRSENARNRKRNKNNKSGFKGVVSHRAKWQAKIHVNGQRKHLGTFDTPELAYIAYCDAARQYHGEFANLG
jgi:hypothetical protein